GPVITFIEVVAGPFLRLRSWCLPRVFERVDDGLHSTARADERDTDAFTFARNKRVRDTI
ncbi:hypothetical protein, partial [Corynebacterium sp. HMSC034B08]|uniref:hypothetical protein n=1 Tax=Corynebacterium sp. HMSC034B08 TaxID=1715135 RepID=UPI001AF022F6